MGQRLADGEAGLVRVHPLREEDGEEVVDRPRPVRAGREDLGAARVVVGAELVDAGKRVVLLEDVLFSEEPHVGPAIRRMEAAGAVPSTVKTLAYELRRSVAEPSLAARLRERAFPIELPTPEDLPEWRPGWEGAATQRAEPSVASPLEWASQA